MAITKQDVPAIEEIYNLTRQNGGATYTFSRGILNNVGEHDIRYVVGGVVESHVVREDQFTPTDVAMMFDIARGQHRTGVGTWKFNGEVFVDVIDVHKNLDRALEVARSRGELAIWDLATSTEITVADVA